MDQQTRMAMTYELAAGRFEDAQALIEGHLGETPDDLMAQAYRGTVWLELGRVEAAQAELARVSAAAQAAGDGAAAAFAELWLGYLNNRRRDRAAALVHFERAAAAAPPGAELCGVLCQTHAAAGNQAKAREWGARSLALRAAEGRCRPSERVERRRPHPFDPQARRRNVLSFSLFGADRFYGDCAVTVARAARGIFPEFVCRFYCGPEIGAPLRKALGAAGAQVMLVNETSESPHPYAGLMWRFLALDDPEVHLVLVRDVDSPFTLRERLAVDLWLRHDAPFLTIRDHVHHTEPLMAGMWGGFTGLLPRLGPAARRFLPPDRSRYVDQQFLRRFVWPRIREATLAVDSVYRLGETADFPPEAPPASLIPAGTGWSRAQIVGPT